MAAKTYKGLLERLKDGGTVVCAEGYMWELERRGYLRCGVFTPEVVMDHPERVRSLHEEFVHSGSDVCEAFTYYGHRSKMQLIGREDELEELNLRALKIAREVADETGTLMAGNLSNTTTYDPDDSKSIEEAKSIFKEQVEWAVQGKADYIIAETFNDLCEAMLALEAIKTYGKGLPAVITMTSYFPDRTTDDVPYPEAMRRLEEAGAAVVGLNCGRGPQTMLPLMKEIRKACKGPIAALPVAFRTTPDHKCLQSLKDPVTGEGVYPTGLSVLQCSRSDIRKFAIGAKDIGIQYIGLCCGNQSFYLREVAEVYGRTPPSSKFSPNPEKNAFFGGPEIMKPHTRKVRSFMTGETR